MRRACAPWIPAALLSAALGTAALGAGDGASERWARALASSLRGLDPIAAAQIKTINPDLKLQPGLLRLRALDPQDEHQRAALDVFFRSLHEKGFTPQRLAAVRLDGSADPKVVEEFSQAYEAGLAHARAFSSFVAKQLERSTTRDTTPAELATLRARLTAMSILFGDAAVADAKRSLARRRQADGAAAAVLYSLP